MFAPLHPSAAPELASPRFRKLASLAGVPVIKLHEARHSAASLARDAEVDHEIPAQDPRPR